jgi:outer membrane protein assembly factor BamB
MAGLFMSRSIRLALTVAATLAFVAGIAGSANAADWPRYRGPNDDGIAETVPLEKLALTFVWKASIGDSFGQIAVVGAKAFLMSDRAGDEYCVCLDAATGKEAWSTRIDKTIKDANGDGPRSTPAIDGKHVYVYGTYTKLYCLELETGKPVWNHDVISEQGGKPLKWGSASSPLVIGDLVLVTGGGPGKGILAYKKDTGELAWAKTNYSYTYATPTIATIKGTLQAICFMANGLVSVDPTTGDVLWTFAQPVATATCSSPVVGGKNGDVVYCSNGYNIGAAACQISKDGQKWTAKELWHTTRQNMSLWSTPVYRDGYIYGLFNHNDNSGPLACLDIMTGTVKWSQKGFGSQGGLLLVGDKLLVQTPKGDLVLVAASSDAYKELGRVNILTAKDWTAPTLANGMIYARNSCVAGGVDQVTCLKLGH